MLKQFTRREAIANKYGWKIYGWSVELDNQAGISLQPISGPFQHLRFQHSDSLREWEKVLKENRIGAPRKNTSRPKGKPTAKVKRRRERA